MIAQKVESTSLRGVHNSSLGRVQLQTFGFHPLLHLFQSGLRLGLAAALDDEVVGLARPLPAPLGHLLVLWVEIDVG